MASYAPHVRPIAETLCWQGLRIGEALRLDLAGRQLEWQRHIYRRHQNRATRSVSLHHRVRLTLRTLWTTANRPSEGRVFLNRFGRPYATAPIQIAGWQPDQAGPQDRLHARGHRNFRIDDWRHHWACQCVMAGIDLETIRQEGGWKSLRMVERYGTVSAEASGPAMRKLK